MRKIIWVGLAAAIASLSVSLGMSLAYQAAAVALVGLMVFITTER